MFKKTEKEPKLVGALEKLEAAQRMKDAKREEKKREDARTTAALELALGKQSQMIPVIFIFILSVLFAMLLLEGSPALLSTWHPTGFSDIDQLLAGASIPNMTGDGEMDKLIVLLVRGALLFVLAGVVPFLALITTRVLGRKLIDPLIACWLVLVALPFLVYFFLQNSGYVF